MKTVITQENSTLTIITDNKFRNLVYGYELTDKEKKEFDYIDAEEIDTHDFFRYKGNVYDPSEFLYIGKSLFPKNWQGYSNDTFFSGIVVEYSEDREQIKVGRFYS